MFNAFLDGSKPAIESAAIANATGLEAPSQGLAFPPGSVDDIPSLMRPRSEGGVLEAKGQVEVVSCLTADGAQIPNDIRKGVWVCFEGDSEYTRGSASHVDRRRHPKRDVASIGRDSSWARLPCCYRPGQPQIGAGSVRPKYLDRSASTTSA
jgi:predicted homoserine dehydrogenase-like protein